MDRTISIDDVVNETIRTRPPQIPPGTGKFLGIIIVLFFMFIFIIAFCLVTIPAGHVGVKYSWIGGVQDDELPPCAASPGSLE